MNKIKYHINWPEILQKKYYLFVILYKTETYKVSKFLLLSNLDCKSYIYAIRIQFNLRQIQNHPPSHSHQLLLHWLNSWNNYWRLHRQFLRKKKRLHNYGNFFVIWKFIVYFFTVNFYFAFIWSILSLPNSQKS